MDKSQKKTTVLVVAWLILPVIIGLLFYNYIVGPQGSTSVFSIIFGWQWIALLGIAVYLTIKSVRLKSKRIMLAALALFVGLLATFIPAYTSEQSGQYILGDGSPAGPEFNCLVWDNPPNFGHFERDFCLPMSIPSYTKAWIDQNPDHERDDSTDTYYSVLWFSEVTLAAFAYLGLAVWLTQNRKNLTAGRKSD